MSQKFKPTFLYIKEHGITGMRYLGKTTKTDPKKYNGSGKYWKRHIEKYGKEHVRTIWSLLITDKKDLIEFATFMSEEFNIVESKKWANLMIENGLDGALPGKPNTTEQRSKISKSMKGIIRSEDTRKKIALAKTGLSLPPEHKANISASRKGIPWSENRRQAQNLRNNYVQ